MNFERIEQIINESKKSTTAFFKEFGLNHNTLSDWKRGKGKPSIVTLIKIAEKYNVTIDYLVGLTDVPTVQGQAIPSSEIQEAYNLLSDRGKERLLHYAGLILESEVASQDNKTLQK